MYTVYIYTAGEPAQRGYRVWWFCFWWDSIHLSWSAAFIIKWGQQQQRCCWEGESLYTTTRGWHGVAWCYFLYYGDRKETLEGTISPGHARIYPPDLETADWLRQICSNLLRLPGCEIKTQNKNAGLKGFRTAQRNPFSSPRQISTQSLGLSL